MTQWESVVVLHQSEVQKHDSSRYRRIASSCILSLLKTRAKNRIFLYCLSIYIQRRLIFLPVHNSSESGLMRKSFNGTTPQAQWILSYHSICLIKVLVFLQSVHKLWDKKINISFVFKIIFYLLQITHDSKKNDFGITSNLTFMTWKSETLSIWFKAWLRSVLL